MGLDALDRFMAKVALDNNGCLVWIAALDREGYGRFQDDGKNQLAHRWIYEQSVGPISEGLEPDHLCRNRACVNVEHLEPVTHRVNMQRGELASRTRCVRGHEYTEATTIRNRRGGRQCRTCHNDDVRCYEARRRAS